MSDPVSVPIADCSICPFRGKTLLMGRCMPADTCVMAHSGRQIDRFFRVNPVYAERYLQDNFWERRACAVRYAPQKALLALIDDEDEVVRRAVAYRIATNQLQYFLHDEDREVRMTVADRIALNELEQLANDKDLGLSLSPEISLNPRRT